MANACWLLCTYMQNYVAHNRSYCIEFWTITWQTSVCCAEKGVDIMPGKNHLHFMSYSNRLHDMRTLTIYKAKKLKMSFVYIMTNITYSNNKYKIKYHLYFKSIFFKIIFTLIKPRCRFLKAKELFRKLWFLSQPEGEIKWFKDPNPQKAGYFLNS